MTAYGTMTHAHSADTLASVRRQEYDDSVTVFLLGKPGTWLRDTPIPPDRSNYDPFGMLQRSGPADVRAIGEAIPTLHPVVIGSRWFSAIVVPPFLG